MMQNKVANVLLGLNQFVYDVLTESDSYPYTPTVPLSGIGIVNDGGDTVTVVVNDGTKDITINCTTNNRTYQGSFTNIASINVTAGTTYQIELKGL
jgi:hypothetical protein